MKRVANCLVLSVRNLLSLLMPILFVVVLIVSLRLSIGVSQDLIYVDALGRPLKFTPCAAARPERINRLLELLSNRNWHQDREILAECDRLMPESLATKSRDGTDAHVEQSPPGTMPLPAAIESTPQCD